MVSKCIRAQAELKLASAGEGRVELAIGKIANRGVVTIGRADAHDPAVRLDEDGGEGRDSTREAGRDAAILAEGRVERTVGVEPADRARAAGIGPLATGDEDLPVGLQGERVVELSVTERGDSLATERRVDAEIGVEPQHEPGGRAAVSIEAPPPPPSSSHSPSGCWSIASRPVPTLGKLRTPPEPKPMSRLPSELKWTSPALEPPLALPMAPPTRMLPSDSTATASAVSVPGETLTVTRPSVPKVVSSVPLLFKRNRAIFPDALPATTILPSGSITTPTTLPKFGNGTNASPCWPKLVSGCPRASDAPDGDWSSRTDCHDFPVGLKRDDLGPGRTDGAVERKDRHAVRAKRRVEVARADLARVMERERCGWEDAECGATTGVAQSQVDGLVAFEVAAWID